MNTYSKTLLLFCLLTGFNSLHSPVCTGWGFEVSNVPPHTIQVQQELKLCLILKMATGVYSVVTVCALHEGQKD